MSIHLLLIKELTSLPSFEFLCSSLLKIIEKNDNISAEYLKIKNVKQLYIDTEKPEKIVRRVFVETDDSGVYSKVGWIMSCDITACMICSLSFSSLISFFIKHHCRACGSVVCLNCYVNNIVVHEIINSEPTKVCKLCYNDNVQLFL
jgi:hypothetical protein